MYQVQIIIWQRNSRIIDKKFASLASAGSWLRKLALLAKNIVLRDQEGPHRKD